MAEIKLTIKVKCTVWYYVAMAACVLRSERLLEKCHDKPIINYWINGKKEQVKFDYWTLIEGEKLL